MIISVSKKLNTEKTLYTEETTSHVLIHASKKACKTKNTQN